MEKYKIVQVLKSLDKKELRRFGEFVSSPYFNKNQNVINLFMVMEKFHPDFKSRNLNPEYLFSKVFPGEKYDYHKISNIISDLYSLTEKYFTQIGMESDQFNTVKNSLKFYRLKELYKIYEQKFDACKKMLSKIAFKDEDYFYKAYELYGEYLWYATVIKPNTELNTVQTVFDNFFKFALIRLLKFYNLMLHERNQNNIEYKLTMLGEILEFIRTGEMDETPAILVFKTILLLLHTKEKKYYDELWELKSKYLNEFTYDDKHLIFIHLYDYAAYMVNFKSDDEYNKDMFKIHKENIELKLMTPESFLYPNFMNVVKLACRVKDYEFAYNFMRDFKSSIPEDEKKNVLEFCEGTIEHSKGHLVEALKHFSKTNFQNFIFKVQVKILLLQCYFQLNMYDQSLAMIDTFRHYLKGEKNLLPDHAKSYNMFLNLISELLRVKENPGQNEFDLKLKKIEEQTRLIPSNPFRIKIWLLEQIEKQRS